MTQSMLDMSLDDIVAAHRDAAGDAPGRGGRGRGGGFGGRRGSFRGAQAGGGFASSFRGRGRGFSSWRRGDEDWEDSRSHAPFSRRRAFSPYSTPYSDRDGRWGPSRRGDRRGAPAFRESGGRTREPTAVVRVSNLDYSVLEEDLKELFAAVGEVVKVWLEYDRTDRSKGTGGCIFRHLSDAKRAIELFEGRRIEGLPLRLELLPPRHQETRRSPNFGPYGQDAFSRRGDRGSGSWRGVQDVEPW
ncbi:hypothetical protein NCLIV_043070 [Neospora caninum Liverpool]|uniref:THO complex subunit 4 n=1 Tax=Neospora caninum (strain Liverpool) TaxID=572307 RepID=F0VCA5_NEOCL|nr:hypothetical protein NCLIV_043070 [Neospora caninum Liverpool]CBZ51239.1 hypothetical protein NCLIV_043070 [Neospora caninum Liverpool]CEL68554.1 TPA: THO complex subunit 4 [Neospora caninum Liverpool]|eukprot:XP_003881272.1 hypothetical protein NCLIV_043070 [Neospora caninum Liverpool]